MRYAAQGNDGALFWADRGVGYVVSGGTDRERLTQVARLVYDQTEKGSRRSEGLSGSKICRTAIDGDCGEANVPIRTLKIWNQVMGASHYRTG